MKRRHEHQSPDRALAEKTTKGPYTLATSTALATCLVNDAVAVSSGDTSVAVDTSPEAMAEGVFETLLEDENGYLTEGCSTNLFVREHSDDPSLASVSADEIAIDRPDGIAPDDVEHRVRPRDPRRPHRRRRQWPRLPGVAHLRHGTVTP